MFCTACSEYSMAGCSLTTGGKYHSFHLCLCLVAAWHHCSKGAAQDGLLLAFATHRSKHVMLLEIVCQYVCPFTEFEALPRGLVILQQALLAGEGGLAALQGILS